MTSKMRDGLVKRGATWSYVVRVPDPATGKTKPQWKGGFATKKEAKEARAKAMAAVANGNHVDPSKLTVAEFLRDRWLPAKEATGPKPTYLRALKMHVEQHIAPRIGGVRLQALRGDTLNALYAQLLENGRSDGTGGLSAATVSRVHALMSKALGDAVRWQLVTHNAAKAADPPRQKRPGDHDLETWTADELRSFLGSIEDHELYPLFLLYATTGMRRGEALALRWADVDLEKGQLAIRRTLVVVSHRLEESAPKTKRSRRTISLDSTTVAALRRHRKAQLEARMGFGAAWVDRDLVFTRGDGDWLHPEKVSKTFSRLARDAELPAIRLHDLRHTYATLALAGGVPAKVVSDRLGHATVAFTLDVYTHAVPDLEEEAAETVARMVLG